MYQSVTVNFILGQHKKPAVFFEVLYFLLESPKISEEQSKGYVLSDFVTMKAPSLKAFNTTGS